MPIIKSGLGKLKLGIRKLGQITIAGLPKIFDFSPSNVNARGAARFISSSNQYLSITSNTTLQGGDFDWFIAGWIYLDSAPASYAAFLSKYTEGNPEWEVWINADRTVSFATYPYDGGQADTTAISLSSWTFVFAYQDNTAKKLYLSINNGSFNQSTTYSSSRTASTNPFMIGRDVDSGLLDGRVDNVILGKPPTSIASLASTIRDSLYNGGAGKVYGDLTSAEKTDWGLISYWELDELSGDRVDSHGSNDLSPVNSPGAADGVVEGPADDLDPVVIWGGNSISLTQETIANRPTYRTGSPSYIDFDGTDDQMSYEDDVLLNRSSFTHFLKIYLDALPTTGNEMVIYCEETEDGTTQYRLTVDENGNVKAYRTGLVTATSASTISTAAIVKIAVQRNGSTLSVFTG